MPVLCMNNCFICELPVFCENLNLMFLLNIIVLSYILNISVLVYITAGLVVERVCKNAGHCVNVGNSHQCKCQSGYTGSYCEEMVDECQSNPCRNGATCKDYQGTYECVVSIFLGGFFSARL